jgi:hypothetical protein
VRVERWLAALALALLAVSLVLPAVRGSGFPAQTGLDILRQGAGLWRDGVVSWYANPALVAGALLVLAGFARSALTVTAMALLLALSSFRAADTLEQAGRSVPPFEFAAGFYVWIAAMIVGVAAAGIQIYKVLPRRQP